MIIVAITINITIIIIIVVLLILLPLYRFDSDVVEHGLDSLEAPDNSSLASSSSLVLTRVSAAKTVSS